MVCISICPRSHIQLKGTGAQAMSHLPIVIRHSDEEPFHAAMEN
jgi:hypothetical protein